RSLPPFAGALPSCPGALIGFRASVHAPGPSPPSADEPRSRRTPGPVRQLASTIERAPWLSAVAIDTRPGAGPYPYRARSPSTHQQRRQSMSPTLPAAPKQPTRTGWALLLTSVAFFMVITAASIGERFGRRRVYVAGLALFSLASAACALAPSTTLLIAARAMQGLG